MSTDLKNSILLWVGTVVFMGLSWAALRFDVLPELPPKMHWAMFGLALAVTAIRFIWDRYRRRKGEDR